MLYILDVSLMVIKFCTVLKRAVAATKSCHLGRYPGPEGMSGTRRIRHWR